MCDIPTSESITGISAEDEKWRIFSASLEKVRTQVHPNLQIDKNALNCIESLIIDLLKKFLEFQPRTVKDVDEQVRRTFPRPLDTWAINEANGVLERRRNKKSDRGVTLPVDKVHALLKEFLGYRLDHSVTLYIVAILDYLAADILKFAGNYVRNMDRAVRDKIITEEDVKVSVRADRALSAMFYPNDSSDDISESTYSTRLQSVQSCDTVSLDSGTGLSYQSMEQTYEDLVKDMIASEQRFLSEVELIIRVFREPFMELFPHSKDIDSIFSNILEINSFSRDFLGALEDVVEATDPNEVPHIGVALDDMIEGMEFDVYERYIQDICWGNRKLKDRLYALLSRPDLTARLNECSPGFKDVTKYVLPMLLEMPLRHIQRSFEIMEKLRDSDQSDEDDKECFFQALSSLMKLKGDLERSLHQLHSTFSLYYFSTRISGNRTERHYSVQTMSQIQNSIENWDSKDLVQLSNHLLYEGMMFLNEKGRKHKERHVFLFDNMILLCKPSINVKRYKFKEKYLLRNIEIVDQDENDPELKNAFELQPRNHPSLFLSTKTMNEKVEFMSAILTQLHRSNLERMLDSKLSIEEVPLVLPSPDIYPFSAEDSEKNIRLEEVTHSPEPPLIQGATLEKLIERLTYHMYADPKFVKRFLTTYRTFCTPAELLDLLIKRYAIPEQSPSLYENRKTLSRFRKEYIKPVQFRVLNVIRQWVDQHFYDFEREVKLLDNLNSFLETIKSKVMRRWVDSIINILKRKVESSLVMQGIAPDAMTHKSAQFTDDAPPIEWHICPQEEEDRYNLITLHPIEIARQETLIQFWLYKSVRPSELVGSVFAKKDKHKHCPNLMKLIQQTNRFIYWLEVSILNTKNPDERVALVNRIIEIMMVFHRMNNFNGVLSIVSALDSAPIYRLNYTFEKLKPLYKEQLELMKDLKSSNFKKYFETLRAIDPPCVPFFGVYMTNILKLEEGNPDFIPNTDLINFTKRCKVADITAEIQQYQNTQYNLTAVSSIQTFLESVDPWEGLNDKELGDKLFDISREIEPKDKPVLKAGKIYDSQALKSPGIKPTHTKSNLTHQFRSHLPSISSGSDGSRFSFTKSSITDEDEVRSTLSSNLSSTPPLTPSSLPVTPPPHTPPYASKRTLPASSHLTLHDTGSQSSLMSSSTVGASFNSVCTLGSTSTISSFTQHTSNLQPHREERSERINLQPPPLPPRPADTRASRLSLSRPPDDRPPVTRALEERFVLTRPPDDRLPFSRLPDIRSDDIAPVLPPKPHMRQRSEDLVDMQAPPPPPRPARSINRSGSMPNSDHRYSRRNSGEHVNTNTFQPSTTPQLPPRTYKGNHSRQCSH